MARCNIAGRCNANRNQPTELLAAWRINNVQGNSSPGGDKNDRNHCVKTRIHSEAASSHYGPFRWNSLPESVRAAGTVDF